MRWLSRIPDTRPEIEIEPFAGDPFGVDLLEAEELPVPLRVGAEGWAADYDALSGRQLEARHCRVARLLKARGTWAYEVANTIGGIIDGRFTLIASYPSYYHSSSRYSYLLTEDRTSRRLPRHISPDGAAAWAGPDTLHGPDDALMLPLGNTVVSVDGRRVECIRALTTTQFVVEPGAEALASRYAWIVESYISRAGRTVLSRRYQTAAHRDLRGYGVPEEASWPEGRAHIRYNDTDCYHWFDVVTDAAMDTDSCPGER